MVEETNVLDKPSIPDVETEENEVVVAQVDTPPSEAVTPEKETVVEEPARVPYSRFETVHERAIRAEEEAKHLRSQLEAQRPSEPIAFSGDLPEKWVKLYGDNEASREAYSLYRNGIKEEFSVMKGDLISEIRREEIESEERANATAEEWATTMQDFASRNNRKFSDADESALLDVMDELTPKDDKGMYVVSPITYLPKAVELYDLRNQKVTFAKKEARRSAAELAGAKGDGEPGALENTGHFRPGQWDSWRSNPSLRG